MRTPQTPHDLRERFLNTKKKPPDLRDMLNKARAEAETLQSYLVLLDLTQQQNTSFMTVFGEAISQEVQKQMGRVFEEFECPSPRRADADAEYEEWFAGAAEWATPTLDNFIWGWTAQQVRDREDLFFLEGYEKKQRSESKKRQTCSRNQESSKWEKTTPEENDWSHATITLLRTTQTDNSGTESIRPKVKSVVLMADRATSRINLEATAPHGWGQRPLNTPPKTETTPGHKVTRFGSRQEDPEADIIINRQGKFIKN